MNLPELVSSYCNAHARRKFKAAEENFPEEAQLFIDEYQAIYRIEDLIKEGPPESATDLRKQMVPHFEKMRTYAMDFVSQCSEKSSLGKAIAYFLRNYTGFILFTKIQTYPSITIPKRGFCGIQLSEERHGMARTLSVELTQLPFFFR